VTIRKPVIAGNWKMNKGPVAAHAFCARFAAAHAPREDRSILLFPPAISFSTVREALSGRTDLGLGVQDLHWEPDGAFTGELSAAMAREAGARYALCGHSERRHIFGESDQAVGRKAAAALAAGIVPIVCVGELLEERRAGRVADVILRQLDAALDAIPAGAESVILAYEPVWAIGTGVVATPQDASEAHAVLRARVGERLGEAVAAGMPILYGGSVKPDNAAALLAADDVDGLLVGGASLDPSGFAAIAAA